jgi:hypothetical protein
MIERDRLHRSLTRRWGDGCGAVKYLGRALYLFVEIAVLAHPQFTVQLNWWQKPDSGRICSVV